MKLGGWRLGLLVARNCYNPGRGRMSKSTIDDLKALGKVPMSVFAREADVSDMKVARFLEAWNRAAADIEELPTSDELAPGSELDPFRPEKVGL